MARNQNIERVLWRDVLHLPGALEQLLPRRFTVRREVSGFECSGIALRHLAQQRALEVFRSQLTEPKQASGGKSCGGDFVHGLSHMEGPRGGGLQEQPNQSAGLSL